MSKFKVGDKVIKARARIAPDCRWKPIATGDINTIRNIVRMDESECLYFDGIHNGASNNGIEYGYESDVFEPLHESLTGFVEMTYTKIIEQIPIGQS